MALPERAPRRIDEPDLDPGAVARAYRLQRAKRRARRRREREARQAGLRFWLAAGALLLGGLVLAVTIWGEITRLFGL